MKQRPILVAVIGYIIGILGGLYFRFSIVLCYILLLAIFIIQRKIFFTPKKRKFKLISLKRYSRYLKLFINRKVILILIISSILSNSIVLWQNQNDKNAFQDGEKLEVTGIIVSQKIEKQYYNLYQVKLLGSKHFNLLIQVNKKEKDLAYGDKIKLEGEYKAPAKQRNYGGYDDAMYLKTLKIVGRMKVDQIEVLGKRQQNFVLQFSNDIKQGIEEKIEQNLEQEKAGILKGLLLGDTQDLEEEVKEAFQISNISHILAISGMHISYLILGLQLLFSKGLGKKRTKILTIIVLMQYIFITGFSPSITRAVVMGIITIMGGLFHRKSDVWNSLAISLLGILIYNPYLICHVGLQLSYLGTIGILLFHTTILQIFNQIPQKRENDIVEKIKEFVAVSLSAQIMILPALFYHFNHFSIYFLMTNLLVSFAIGPLIIVAFFSILMKPLFILVSVLLDFLNFVSSFSQLPFSKIYIATPRICMIILYVIGILIARKLASIYQSNKGTATDQRIKNLIALFRYRFREKKKFYLRCSLIMAIIITILFHFPKSLKIYFVDVGQGDCTFMVTPQNKTILIDGGGSLKDEFDVGKKTLIPYLLDRGYTTIDYVFISHFDQDHVAGLLSVMEELHVKNVVISKQGEASKQYEDFKEKVKQKRIKVLMVKKGDRVTIEKGIYFNILWPKDQLISENILNNNSMVAKLTYNQFSMLFTGDIEKIAERAILENYGDANILKSVVLKVGHHGSKTSSTEEFLKAVKPKIALIRRREK